MIRPKNALKTYSFFFNRLQDINGPQAFGLVNVVIYNTLTEQLGKKGGWGQSLFKIKNIFCCFFKMNLTVYPLLEGSIV